METIRITALVLAAGYSSRMAQFKPLLDLGGKPVIVRVIDSFREAGIKDVRVVTGYKKASLKPLLSEMGIQTVENEHYDDGMFSSVIAGINSLGAEAEAFYVLPADVPLVRPWTIRHLADSFVLGEDRIVVPCFYKKTGHPPLIAASIKEQIVGYNGADGLRGALKQCADNIRMVRVPDENIGFDIDEPADYVKLLHKWEQKDIPSLTECEVILTDILSIDQPVMLHSRAVANVAGKMADALKRAGIDVNRDLVISAALLHDVARDRPDHANVSAGIVRDMGYPAVADVIRCHMDIVYSPQQPVGAAEVLYLADKLVLEDKVVSLAERFERSLFRNDENAAIRYKIENRYNNALQIMQSMEAVIGPLEIETGFAGIRHGGGR